MMASNETRYGILVGVDGSQESDAAIRWAAAEAKMLDAPITLMHAAAATVTTWPMAPLPDVFIEAEQENATIVIGRARDVLEAEAGAGHGLDVRTDVQYSSPVPALADASKEALMVVVGGSGMGALEKALLGSVSSGLVHYAHGPVVVVHTKDGRLPDSAAPVVLGVDGSPASEAATKVAFAEADRRRAELLAVHSWSDVGILPVPGRDLGEYEQRAEELLAERLAGWREEYPDVVVKRRVVRDKPAQRLLEEARDAQLLVVGSRGRGGFTGMVLGSVGSTVAQSAQVPVIVVRPR